MSEQTRLFAVVTGASAGIGYELARCAAEGGFDLLIAADEPRIHQVAAELQRTGANVQAVQADLSTPEGVTALVAAAGERPIDALLANVGIGYGHAFLDQNFEGVQQVIDVNITGTLYLLQKVGRKMRERKAGRILITGSIAGFTPGPYLAVYNATKAFINSFSYAFREELRDQGANVTVTCLMPGATETEFFEKADMLDTKVGQSRKADPTDVARAGFAAMLRGDANVVAGLNNKLQTAAASVLPAETLAEQHKALAKPGSAYGDG